MRNPAYREMVVTVFLMLFLVRLPVSGDDDLTRGGFTLPDMINCYTRNVKGIGSENVAMSVDKMVDGLVLRERVFNLQSYVMPVQGNSLTNKSVILVFASRNILHDVQVYSLIVGNCGFITLHNDAAAIDFVSKNAAVDSEADLCNLMKAFAMIRAYDVVPRRPKSVDMKALSSPMSDDEWGVRCWQKDGLRYGHITVCTSVHSRQISRYEFKVNINKIAALQNKLEIYKGVDVR